MDWGYVKDIIPLFREASVLTLRLALEAFALSIALGFIGSVILCQGPRILKPVVHVLIQLGRNVPILVMLYFLFFGLVRQNIRLDSHTCAVLALGFMGSAYMTEAFRAAWLAIDKVQFESARSLGLSLPQTLWHVIWPQAFSVAIPSMLANAHAILMETAMCGFIAVPELMALTRDQIGMYYKTYECFMVLTICYVVILMPFSLLAGYAERRFRHV